MTARKPSKGTLPYRDTKPQGAADFYLAINATFRFILDRLGYEGWVTYVEDMARDYYRPVWEQWRHGGLDAVAAYFDEAFRVEPGAVYDVRRDADAVVLTVHECPAIKHLRNSGRTIVPEYCRHCYIQCSTMAEQAGLHMRLKGGNGSCRQTFTRTEPPPQDMNDIEVAQ